MRKNNDGYVIIYVIFVILFLCIVAIGTCSSALSNLQSQNEAVVQMQERYAAEGEIEKQVAELCANISRIRGTDTKDPYTDAHSEIEKLFDDAVRTDNIYVCVLAASGVEVTVEFAVAIHRGNERAFYTYEDGTLVPEEEYDPNQHIKVTIYDYTVSVTSKYLTYTAGGDAA